MRPSRGSGNFIPRYKAGYTFRCIPSRVGWGRGRHFARLPASVGAARTGGCRSGAGSRVGPRAGLCLRPVRPVRRRFRPPGGRDVVVVPEGRTRQCRVVLAVCAAGVARLCWRYAKVAGGAMAALRLAPHRCECTDLFDQLCKPSFGHRGRTIRPPPTGVGSVDRVRRRNRHAAHSRWSHHAFLGPSPFGPVRLVE